MDRAGVARDRLVVLVESGDGNTKGRARGAAGRGTDREMGDGSSPNKIGDDFVGERRASAGDQVVVRPGRKDRAARTLAAGDVVVIACRKLVEHGQRLRTSIEVA